MEQLLQDLREFSSKNLSYEGLGEFVRNVDTNGIDYEAYMPEQVNEGYSRNILMMEPMELEKEQSRNLLRKVLRLLFGM